MPCRDFYTTLVHAHRRPIVDCPTYYTLKLLGVEIPRPVDIWGTSFLYMGDSGW